MSTLNEKDKIYLTALVSSNSFGPVTLNYLRKHFNSFFDLYSSNYNKLYQLGIKDNIINKFLSFRKSNKFCKILEKIEEEKIKIIFKSDDFFPKLMREIHSCPLLLFALGNIKILNNKCLTTVGSRIFTYYGQKITRNLIKETDNKICIVSGLAKGIDAIAHTTALETNKKTIAIFGCGLNSSSVYPKENHNLYQQIIERGSLIISEFPPFTPPLKSNFPRRNRLLAAISKATLVIEAKNKSGALITANLALDFNRDVLAVPKNIDDKYFQATNFLIKSGATPILTYNDINDYFNIDKLEKNTLN